MSEKIYYIYRHIRLDTNDVFYVGKGTKKVTAKSFEGMYGRAFSKKKNSRSFFWFRIANKTHIETEILFESADLNFIYQKEMEFIKLYGRKDLNSGTLINFCEGGSGIKNLEPDKMKLMLERKKQGSKRGKDHYKSKEVYVYNLDGTFYKKFDTILSASKELGVCPDNITTQLSGKNKGAKGLNIFVFKSSYEGEFVDAKFPPHPLATPIQCFRENGDFVAEFSSIRKVAKHFQFRHKAITESCDNNSIYRGYRFSYIVKTSLELAS